MSKLERKNEKSKRQKGFIGDFRQKRYSNYVTICLDYDFIVSKIKLDSN